MININRKFFTRFFSTGHKRTQKLKKNIAGSFIIKGFSIILGLITVPILLNYLDSEKYGVWLTIASIIMWVQHFDLGLGHGLRNRLSEALATNDFAKAKRLISTAYYSMVLLMLSLFFVLLPIVSIVDWNSILNVTIISAAELKNTIILVLFMFILRFIFQLISVILKADQRPAISDLFLPLSSLFSLLIIIGMKSLVQDSLFWASAAMAIPPVIVLIVANLYFFRFDYHQYHPSIQSYKRKHLKEIYSIGMKFFLGQLLALVMFNSSNLILTKVINPEEVTVYNIARTYFNLPLTFFIIILTPYWSAITEAYVKEEYNWIKQNMNRLTKIAIVFSFGLFIMLIFSNFAFRFWIGDKVSIPLKLSVLFTVYNTFILFLSPYNYFLNGVGKLNLGLRIGIIKIIVFLPIAISFAKLFGATGLVVALIVVNALPNSIFNALQYNKIINRRATGIWNQ